MEAVPEQDLEAGKAALRRLELIQLARGERQSPWFKLPKERLVVLMLICGVLTLLHHPDFSRSYAGAIGIVVIVTGLMAPRDRSSERLDALVEYLDSTGQLEPNPDRAVDG